MRNERRGFTLIELMIVVAIIGILAAVALPKMSSLLTKSREASVKGTLGAVRSALSVYYADTESYPASGALFASLTTNLKYLGSVDGVPSLGRYEIPRNDNGNPGHTSGVYSNASSAAAVVDDSNGDSIVDAADGMGPLVYVSSGVQTGGLYINCSHFDTKAIPWTSH